MAISKVVSRKAARTAAYAALFRMYVRPLGAENRPVIPCIIVRVHVDVQEAAGWPTCYIQIYIIAFCLDRTGLHASTVEKL